MDNFSIIQSKYLEIMLFFPSFLTVIKLFLEFFEIYWDKTLPKDDLEYLLIIISSHYLEKLYVNFNICLQKPLFQ